MIGALLTPPGPLGPLPFAPFALAPLPARYTDLLARHMNRTPCELCGDVPGSDAAVCLTCGAVVCCHRPECRRAGKGGCTSHAECCGGGASAFVVLSACSVLLLLGQGRRGLWKSLYLDENGEEDRNLVRGKVRLRFLWFREQQGQRACAVSRPRERHSAGTARLRSPPSCASRC